MHICPHCKQEIVLDDLEEASGPMPPGCICDFTEWGLGPLPPICGGFGPMSDEEPELCGWCQHERGCHAAKE